MQPASTSEFREWGESASLFAMVLLFIGLSNRYTLGGPIVTYALGALVGTVFVMSIFVTVAGSGPWKRGVMMTAGGICAIAVIASMAKIVYLVVYHASEVKGLPLLETALFIWVGNVVTFAIIYHWLGQDDFVFLHPPNRPETRTRFLDFLFLSFTTATAFSPTDTPPLTTRARMLMMFESVVSLTTIAIAAARAVNILS